MYKIISFTDFQTIITLYSRQQVIASNLTEETPHKPSLHKEHLEIDTGATVKRGFEELKVQARSIGS